MPTSPAPGLTNDLTNKPTQAGRFSLPRDITPAERSTLIAGGLGWLLDAMDVMLFSLVLAYLVREFSMDTRTAGFLNSLTLIASAIGGFFFGFLADRIGRTRALMASILVYSIASAACAFTHTIPQLGFCRFVLGLGMGGEWTTAAAADRGNLARRASRQGARLDAIRVRDRRAVAAVVVAVVLPHFGWRAVFLVGFLPALIVLWIRSRVPESQLWQRRAAQPQQAKLRTLLQGQTLRNGILATAMNSFAMFGYWGLFVWIPGYLSIPIVQGGRGLSLARTTSFFLILCAANGWAMHSSVFLRMYMAESGPYFAISLIAALLVSGVWACPYAALAADPESAGRLFWYWIFFGIRGHRQRDFPQRNSRHCHGLSYNLGRGLSAGAPFAVGALAVRFGIGPAFLLPAVAYLIAASLALLLPETRARQLT